MMQFTLPNLAEFAEIKTHAIDEYAYSLFRYAECFDKARAYTLSKGEIDGILPEAKPTPGEWIYHIVVDGQHVGYIWYHLDFASSAAFAMKAPKCTSFLTYIYIHEKHRRKGLGAEAMRYYEDKIQKSGAYETTHYVFIGNEAGVKLYEKMGYVIERSASMYDAKGPSRYFMKKRLNQSSP